MKKIFISIPWFHPAFKAGGPIQSIANLVSQYADGVSYRVFTGDTDLNRLPLTGIQKDQWVEYNEYTKVWYASNDHRSDKLVKEVEKWKPDILFIIGIFDWHFNIVPLAFAKATKKIVSVRGMLHPPALSQKPLKKSIFIQCLKLFKGFKRVVFHATDDNEKMYIQQVFGPQARVETAGNFPKLVGWKQAPYKNAGSVNLISVGIVSPMKNYRLVLEALQICRHQVNYAIYGPVKDMEYWQDCLQLIQSMPENIIVHYNGGIPPADIASKLQQAQVFVLPSKSENFGHAIIEALSCGRPVIISESTPWNGLEEKGAGINVDATGGALLKAINKFAEMAQDEYSQWSSAAAEYALQAINVEQLFADYQKLFDTSEPAEGQDI